MLGSLHNLAASPACAARPGSAPPSRRLRVSATLPGGSQAVEAPPAPPQQHQLSTSNIVAAPPGHHAPLTEGQLRKLELQREAQRRLEEDNAWWQADGWPPNMASAGSPPDLKDRVVSAPGLVCLVYFSPSCHGCRSMEPKLRQVAAQNPDISFVKVNSEQSGMRELAFRMGVERLPWFQLFLEGDMVSSFTANLSTVTRLRAKLCTHKPCTDALCTAFE